MQEEKRELSEVKIINQGFSDLNPEFFGKEKFKKEHAKELNRYHRGKRIVMGNRNAEGKVPVSNWKKYLKNM